MKKILITGKNSYIGTSFKKWMSSSGYVIDSIDLRDSSWRESSFAEYDAVLHTAGIAHIKETDENKELYDKINRDLTIRAAKKAKADGVRQFVFLSSMSVYGVEKGAVTKDTVLHPNTNYGKSKLQAENEIRHLNNEEFHVAIIRPPMVYGKNCSGNYKKLSELVKKLPIFPRVNNMRSMIYIDNLSEFIRLVIKNNEMGIFCPQNDEYVNSSDLAEKIAGLHNKKLILTSAFNPFIKIGALFISTVNKVFGSLYYDKEMSRYKENYCEFNFDESIRLTEDFHI